MQGATVYREFPLKGTSDPAPSPYVVTLLEAGKSVHVELVWDGQAAPPGLKPITGDFLWQVTGTVCEGVLPRSINARTEPALFRTSCVAPRTAETSGFAALGDVTITFERGGQRLTEIKPSYLFSVEGEALDPPPQPGAIPGMNGGRTDGEPSTVTVALKLSDTFSTEPVDIDLRITALPSSGGHAEAGQRPLGALDFSDVLPFLPSIALRNVLASNPRPLTKSFQAVSPGGRREIKYTAPFAAGDYRFQALEAGTDRVLGNSILKVRVPGLAPLASSFASGEVGGFTTLNQGIVALFGGTGAHEFNLDRRVKGSASRD